MSNYLAIATVTESLRQVMDAVVKGAAGSGATATALRPTVGTVGLPTSGVNLYLYQVTPNSAMRNVDQPDRRGDGTTLEAPQIALDLHYLLTFYGKDQDLESQRVLGSVLCHLNARPLLTRKSIESAKLSVPVLGASDLEDQIELVRLTMVPMNLEELSKLWSVLLQTPYVLSAVYQASVVLIRGDEVVQPALPVFKRRLYVETFRQPRIEGILSRKGSGNPQADLPIVLDDTLVLVGNRLKSQITRVRVGGAEVEPSEVGETQISVLLRAPPFPVDTLRAGVQGVQVVHRRAMGEPPIAHAGIDSNVVPLVLRPMVTPTATPVSSKMVDGVRLCTNDVSLSVTPAVSTGQRAILLLNELGAPDTRRAFAYCYEVEVVPANPDDASVNPLTIRVEDVAAGEYLVRIQVDGAESPLDRDVDPSDPRFMAPKVSIT